VARYAGRGRIWLRNPRQLRTSGRRWMPIEPAVSSRSRSATISCCGRRAMFRQSGLRRWRAHYEGRHDRRRTAPANPDCDAAGGLPLWASGADASGADRVEARSAFRVTVVFRSKRGDRLKFLVWDGTGLVLVYKALEQGSFAWPNVQDGVMRLSRAQSKHCSITHVDAPSGEADRFSSPGVRWCARGRCGSHPSRIESLGTGRLRLADDRSEGAFCLIST